MKRYVLFGIMVLVLIGLVLTVGPTLAQEPDQDGPDAVSVGEVSPQAIPMGTAFTYQGQLKSTGSLVNDTCDFEFELYDAETNGNQVESTVPKSGVSVSDGLFTVQLDFGADPFTGEARWLEIDVRCPAGSGTYTTLDPRQALTATPYALYSASTNALQGNPITITVPISPGQVLGWDGSQWVPMDVGADHHDHWGETWTGSGTGLDLSGGSTGLSGSGSDYGVHGSGGYGVYGESGSTDGQGVHGYASATGVTNYGVYGWSKSSSGYGGFFVNDNGGFLLAANNLPTTSELEFKVDNDGDVYADGTYHGAGFLAGSADFAEMVLPGQVDLMPGDVLAIGPDGRVVRSTKAYQSTVVGVYSTEPAFIAGYRVDEEGKPLEPERVPLAMIGVVPVKASAENGSIVPGDLLTTSNTPGHAMRAGDDPPLGTVVGKALKPLAEGTGVIEMLVVLQ